MKIAFWYSGSETSKSLQAAIAAYEKRLMRYVPFERKLIALPKGQSAEQRALKEQEKVSKNLRSGDYLILLDEHGSAYTSAGLAGYLEGLFQQSHQRLVFLAGSSHGFHSSLKERANISLALSPLTFNHEHVRLIFTEQLYRCLTIIENDPYHH